MGWPVKEHLYRQEASRRPPELEPELVSELELELEQAVGLVVESQRPEPA